jgi:hypothetical protein
LVTGRRDKETQVDDKNASAKERSPAISRERRITSPAIAAAKGIRQLSGVYVSYTCGFGENAKETFCQK